MEVSLIKSSQRQSFTILTVGGEYSDELPAPGLQADGVEEATTAPGVGDVPELEVGVLVPLHLCHVPAAPQQGPVLGEVLVVQHRGVVPAPEKRRSTCTCCTVKDGGTVCSSNAGTLWDVVGIAAWVRAPNSVFIKVNNLIGRAGQGA